MKKEIILHQVCYHCGDELIYEPLVVEDKQFCCQGCKSVYLLLANKQLCSYYNFNPTPGRKSESDKSLHYLDEPTIKQQLIDYQDNTQSIVNFYIPAIHCSSCIWLLENLYKLHPAIFSSRINFIEKKVNISFKHAEISLREVVELLISIGYEPNLNAQDIVKEHTLKVDKGLILKIAIAGFCMGNVMLFSFPEYFGITNLESNFRVLFAWLNLMLCIPSTFFCAQDYFSSAWQSLKQKRINLDTPLALIIVVLFIRTLVSTLLDNGPGFADTLTALVFLLLMGRWVKQRTYHHISFDRDYRSYFPIAVTSLQEGQEKPVAINDLKVGHRLLIRNGELIPADSILMKGEAWVDMSFVTGETLTQPKVLGEIIYAGAKQAGDIIEVEVIKPVSQSYLTDLWNKDYKIRAESVNFNDSIAKYFTLGVFIISFSALAFWFLQNDVERAWLAFTAVIIVACPCVLALSTPFTFSAILSIFDKQGFYVRNTDAVERFAACKNLVLDKTGTLTTIQKANVVFEGELSAVEKTWIASLVHRSAHPLSRQILKSLAITQYIQPDFFQEKTGLGLVAQIAGHEIILGSVHLLTTKIATARDGVHVQINRQYKGRFIVHPEFRVGLQALFPKLRKRFNLHLLSGDTAKDEPALRVYFEDAEPLLFNQSPIDKLAFIQNLQGKNNRVIMVGDGLNDAGALQQADFGVAVTDDINNFTPGCDAILQGSALNNVPSFHQMSLDGLKIVRISFVIAVLYNCVGLYFAVQGTLYPLLAAALMPLSTITIISFTSIATRYYAKKNQLR
ncbi:MAG: HAD family hydrolase [Pedobacter sp.]|nr:MAG: HAD family hydrolase [Pedobacter sp.]